jgi:hypothetical protein
MVPNGAIALKYAWDSRGQSQNLKDPLAGLKSMGFDSARAAAQVLGLPHESEAQIKAALTAHAPVAKGAPKKNLVFFLMESWGAEPILYQSPTFDVLGRLAPTLGKACHFSNFDSAHAGTHPSLEAILFSTPITPFDSGRCRAPAHSMGNPQSHPRCGLPDAVCHIRPFGVARPQPRTRGAGF